MAVTTMANRSGHGGPGGIRSVVPGIVPLAARRICAAVVAGVLLVLTGCGSQPPEVIVYTAHDEVFSRPVLDGFSEQTGIEVLIKADTESTKTVGLAEAIIAERDRPRCDLFWNNEVLHTLRLARMGLLEPVEVPEAENYPPQYRSSDGTWHGFAARARVLIVNTQQLAESRRPKSIKDLTDPQWRDRCGIAKPLAGTTATHAACLFAAWGEEEARRFFEDVKANCHILSGNRDVARRVASGALAFGLTDTDDAMVEIDAGSPVAIIYPDQREGEVGTLFIPNTLAVIKGSANQQEARQLLSYLLRPETEALLARGSSAQIPLNKNTQEKPRVETPETVKAMEVDFAAAAEQWETVYKVLRDEFASAN